MKTLDHSTMHFIGRSTSSSSSSSSSTAALPTPSCSDALRGSIRLILIAAGLAAAAAAPSRATQLPDLVGGTDAALSTDGHAAVDADSVARRNWRVAMAQNSAPAEGCFHASYPNLEWESVNCSADQPRVHPAHRKPADEELEVTGNGNDFVAEAKGLITFADGGFTTSGVTSEKSVGVAAFGGGGILGPNEYSVQLNTNALETTSACDHHSGCTVWQQFVYATDYLGTGKAGVFIEYWLLNWGSSACPGGYEKYESDCVKNSAYKEAPDVPIKDLDDVVLEGTAAAGGHDSVTFFYGSDAYSVTAKDNVLDISSVWNKVEFNVFGDAGGSRADFNSGSSIAVISLLLDGSTSAPRCIANDGTTGETNNLNLGKCEAFGGLPNIQFSESN